MRLEPSDILVVEDSDVDFLVLQKMLCSIGFEKDAIHWIKQLSDFEFSGESFVLCDLNLPDSNGLRTLKSVLSIVGFDRVPIIVLTGSDDEARADEAIKLGAQDYLVKGTFSQSLLQKTLAFSKQRSGLLADLYKQERANQQLGNYLTSILSTVPSYIIRANENLEIEYINRVFPMLDLKDKTILDFINAADRPVAEKMIRLLKYDDEPLYYQTEVKDEAGQSIWLYSRMSRLDDKSYVLIATDITPRVEARALLEKESLKSQLFQMQQLSSQLNPHFVFNAMSSIQLSILSQKEDESLDFVSKFSLLMRTVLENSRRELLTWEEEWSFLSKYLDIERHRLSGKFEYQLASSVADLESIHLPPMMLQPFVENAVVHGIGNRTDAGGLIQIKIEEKGERVIISVSDNGVGRRRANQLKLMRHQNDHVSRALEINNKRISLFNQLYQTKLFQVTTIDLYENGKPIGTSQKLIIPKKLGQMEPIVSLDETILKD
ncbi:MAG: histidine kinase [Flavobacteriales bacterium]